MKTYTTDDGGRVTVPADDSAVQDILCAVQEYFKWLNGGHTPEAAFLLSGLRQRIEDHREELA